MEETGKENEEIEKLAEESISLLALDKATFTPREVSVALAAELGINADAAYQRLLRFIRGGRIKSTRRFLGHEYRIYKEDVEKILRGGDDE